MKNIITAVYFLFIFLTVAKKACAQDSGKAILQTKTEGKIQEIIDHSSAVTGLAVVDLTTGKQVFSVNPDYVFPQASAIKIPILMEIFKQVHQDKFKFSDTLRIDSEVIVGGTGILKNLEGPLTMSVRNLSVLMIGLSDNSATNILIDLVGTSAINNSLQKLGAKQTRLRRKMMAIEASAKEHENTSTPAEAARLLQMLYNGEFINREISDQIISMLQATSRRESRVAAALPDEVPVAFKPGELAGVSTEWALVLLEERPYAIALMENYKVEGQGTDTMEKLSETLYQYFWRIGNSTRFGVYRDPELMN